MNETLRRVLVGLVSFLFLTSASFAITAFAFYDIVSQENVKNIMGASAGNIFESISEGCKEKEGETFEECQSDIMNEYCKQYDSTAQCYSAAQQGNVSFSNYLIDSSTNLAMGYKISMPVLNTEIKVYQIESIIWLFFLVSLIITAIFAISMLLLEKPLKKGIKALGINLAIAGATIFLIKFAYDCLARDAINSVIYSRTLPAAVNPILQQIILLVESKILFMSHMGLVVMLFGFAVLAANHFLIGRKVGIKVK